MRVWRNWQTRKIQVLMVARLCRFKSCYPHQKGKGEVHLPLFLFSKGTGLEVGAVVNDSPVDCQSRERPSRAVRGANQVLLPAPKNGKFRQKFAVFYSSRRLGMESRVSVHGIAVGVWHHQRCIFLRLDSIRLLFSQFHAATSCGFHTRLAP